MSILLSTMIDINLCYNQKFITNYGYGINLYSLCIVLEKLNV